MAAISSAKDIQSYGLWKKRLEALRQRIRDENRTFLASARVAAMTATYAVFMYDDLRNCGPFDLILFDEASQMGLAHAMMLAGLGRRVMFAGDPNQLPPVVQSRNKLAKKWLGRSPFAYFSRSGVAKCMLDEQWRMAPDICRAVSTVFYDHKLRVADDLDERWLRDRSLSLHAVLGSENVTVVAVDTEVPHRPDQNVCRESAEVVIRLVALLTQSVDASKILVLTPFRAQRQEIFKHLRAAGLSEKVVSTVHRAQGEERLIVIFDPVRPSAGFLNGEEGARLINVAISRAQARLFVILQPDYRSSPVSLTNRKDVQTDLSECASNSCIPVSFRNPQSSDGRGRRGLKSCRWKTDYRSRSRRLGRAAGDSVAI
ncbi:MAG: DNA2/NAM7 family helicase [Acidobacteriaceae bacterium]|nr:DNA2/NAM7 family helicase [Acidobacteriaceae bacterium]